MLEKSITSLIILACCLTSGCGMVVSDHFSRSVGPVASNGYLLRGSGWTDGKYGYVLDDVGQVETADFIAAVQVENYYRSFLAVGFIVPVVPTFGLLREGYDGKTFDEEAGVKVRAALFSKKSSLNFNPCGIILRSDNKLLKPTRFTAVFESAPSTYSCSGKAEAEVVSVPALAKSLFEIELFYPQAVYPAADTQIQLPPINVEGKTIPGPQLYFDKGRKTWGNTIL
jgi:hypothetical protein